MRSFSDFVAAPKHKAAIVAQAPTPAAPVAPAQQGVTVADHRQAARRFHERALAAHRAGRVDDFAVRNTVVADDLAAKLQRFGSFVSDKQAEFAAKIVGWSLPREQKAAAPALPAAKALPAILAVVQAFAKVRVGEISFSKKNGEPLWWIKSGDVLVGKLDAEGAVLFGRRIADAGLDRAAIDAALDRIEADPEAAIKAHGLASGQCGCCGRELTDPESIAAGIGPICARKAGF